MKENMNTYSVMSGWMLCTEPHLISLVVVTVLPAGDQAVHIEVMVTQHCHEIHVC